MGVASSYNSGDERGVAGFHEDLQTANKISPCFRYEGSQLFFTSLSPTNLADATFRCVTIGPWADKKGRKERFLLEITVWFSF